MLKIIAYLKLHPLLNKIVRLTAMSVGLLMAVIIYVALVGVSIETPGLRDKVAAMLTENLGREVRFDGAMQLEISAHPKLKIGGMHIANASGFDGNDFASLGEARLALDLWPLLRYRFQIEELAGSKVYVRLQQGKNGTRNWQFKPTKKVLDAPINSTESSNNAELENLLARLDIKRVSLDNLDVEFIGADSKIHFFELQSLVAHLPAGEPMTLALHGKIEKSHPYQLNFTGGTIAEMVQFDQPWPIDLKLKFMSSELLLNGNVSDSAGAIDFSLGTKNLGEFESLLQTKLPKVGAANISGAVKYAAGNISLENLNGHMGKTTLKGALNFDYGGARPKVRGELSLPLLDLRPFISDKPEENAEPPKSLAEVYREISAATFNLKALSEMDANLTLRVGKWLSLPGDVHDALLQVKLERGRLQLPMQLNMADVKLKGSATVDARSGPAKFKFALGTHDSSIGNLGGLLLGMHDVKGRLNRFDFSVSARGDRGAELMESLDIQLDVSGAKLTYGNGEGERPVQFSLEKFELAFPAGKNLHGELHGLLLDHKFDATLRGGSLLALMRDDVAPIDFEMQAGSARAKIRAVLQNTAQHSESEVTFDLGAPHSGEIATWLGLKPGADAPINVHGIFNTNSTRWHVSDFSLKLGRSDLSADVMRTFDHGRSLIKFQLKGELLDVEQLQSLLPEPKNNTSKVSAAAVNMLDIPILPRGINLADADISVHVKQVVNASPFAIREVNFVGQIRDGMMPVSPFSVNVAETDFKGAIMFDLRTQQPHSTVWISAEKFDMGTVLKKLGIASNIESTIDYLSLQLDLHSSRLGQLLSQSEMLAVVDGGHIAVTDANTSSKMNIVLNHGEFRSAAGAEVNLDLQGSLNSAPVSIGIKTASAADLINPALPIPFLFVANTSGATINLSGGIERPFSKNGMELALGMSGSRLDNLNALARTSLPPWGPWKASGKFVMSAKGYEVSALKLQVGSSQLTGYGKLDTTLAPPRIDVVLTAPSIQLDDFRLGDWSAEKNRPVVAKNAEIKTGLSQKTSKASANTQQLLSPEVLARQNAYLTVQVEQVVSGQDKLGSGKLVAQLENGRAAVGPVVVNTPGGSASLLFKYEPGKKDVQISLRAEAKQFDYGILARRIDRKSEMSGVVSLDVDVNSRTEYLADIFKHGKGHVNFSVWPENLKSGLLDVWAVNVLMALLPAIDSSNESKVNCAIGNFILADGKLKEKSFLIDTSRMRVTGKGAVDFAEGKINLYVQPRAKTPQFLSLAIPIELSGTLDDFKVGVRAGDVVESVGQFVTSVIWVPLKILFGKETPVDGRDVCARVSLQ
jgi:hypothetical protein